VNGTAWVLPCVVACALVALSVASAARPVDAGETAPPNDARAVHDYLLSCGGCHALDGSGSPTVPSLRGVDRLLTKTGGRDYVLRVPGVSSAPLSDARLAALLDWVFGSFGNNAAPGFSEAEVHAARRQPFVDPKAARAALD
jgi:mono/diheme cytochrome c family protein